MTAIAIPPVRMTAAVLAVARATLPVREASPNWGRFVQAIIESAGGTGPESWCASWVYYCGSRVMGREWPLPMTRSCDILLEFGRKHGLMVPADAPLLPGDVFLALRSENDAYHTGFVDIPRPDLAKRAFETLEGNTNDDGSANGIGVFELIRGKTPKTRYEFVRWAAPAP